MSVKPVKLLSAWFGPKPPWYDRFVRQMDEFRTVAWECLPPFESTSRFGEPPGWRQAKWFHKHVQRALKVPCRKWDGVEGVSLEAMCDLRPVYGEVFAHLYAGHEWWGWCDLDMRFGRLDELLPPLLTDDVDVLTFKPEYLSGCLTILRNVPRVTGAFRHDPNWKQVLLDPRYHCWDESPGFLKTLKDAGLRVRQMPELYGYVAPAEPHQFGVSDGKLIHCREVLFCHFMNDVWPIEGEV